jgi:hypothetical protein
MPRPKPAGRRIRLSDDTYKTIALGLMAFVVPGADLAAIWADPEFDEPHSLEEEEGRAT